MSEQIFNPWAAAADPSSAPRSNGASGRLLIEAYQADKIGKNYAPNPSSRMTVVHVEFMPDPGQPMFKRPYDKTSQVWFEDWSKGTLPSLRALGLDITELAPVGEPWVVRAECGFMELPSTWTNDDGEVKHRYALEVISILDDEQPEQQAPAQSSADRKTAAMFLEPLWTQSKHDVDKFHELIAGNPLTAAHFDGSSKEVIDIVEYDQF